MILKRSAVADSKTLVEEFCGAVDVRLDELFALRGDGTDPLQESIRHSLLASGKRVRPILTLATARFFGRRENAALDPACAVEMVHTASLIVDDLPSMDDARLRRGRTANHLVFGEHVATLAAIQLLNRAFGTVARAEGVSGEVRARLGACLSRSIGMDGLVGGQLLDLQSSGRRPDREEVVDMYGRKTGALLSVSIELGALVAGVGEPVLLRLNEFSSKLGLAFQILDDLYDRFGVSEVIGKDVAQDDAKTTLLSHVSAQEACEEVKRLMNAGGDELRPLGSAGEQLADLASSLLEDSTEFASRAATAQSAN